MRMTLSILAIVVAVAATSSPGWGKITISSVSGASAYVPSESDGGTVFGGTAGDPCNDGSALCNNCLYAGTACNPRRIQDGLLLTFNIVSDTYGGKAVIADEGTKLVISNAASSSNYSKGAVATVSILWGDLCDHLDPEAGSCDDAAFALKVRVGISSDESKASAEDNDLEDSHDDSIDVTIAVHGNYYSGGMGDVHSTCEEPDGEEDAICYVEMGRGDEKAYIQDIQHVPSRGFPSSSNNYVYKKIRVMYATSPSATDCNGVTPESFLVEETTNKADLDISAESSSSVVLEKDFVDGLSNGTPYCFKIGVIDSGGNIGWFSPEPIGPIVPEAVYGLLTEDMNCFIATATYGSPLAPEVQVFRSFRDQILLKSSWGRSFVKAYYRWSPPFAQLIREQPTLRKLSEILLWPLWAFAKVATSGNLLLAFFMSGFLLLFFLCLVGVAFYRIRRVQRVAKWSLFFFLTLAIGEGLFLGEAQAQVNRKKGDKLSVEDLVEEERKDPEPAPIESTLPKDEEEALTIPSPDDGEEAPPPVEFPYPVVQPKEESPKSPVVKKKKLKKKRVKDQEFEDQDDDTFDEFDEGEFAAQSGQGTIEVESEVVDPMGRKKKRVRKIHHPLAKKGLYRITSKGEYLYRTNKSEQHRAGSLRFGALYLDKFANPASTNVTFESIYGGEATPALFFDYEWQLFRGYGKGGWKVGTGFMMASGNGRFADGTIAQESFDFVVFPNSVSGIYRFQYWDRQFLVPFVEAGLDYFAFAEIRDDNKPPKFGATPGLHAAAGLNISLTAFGKRTANQIDSEYGVNDIYLTIEGRVIHGLHSSMDISTEVIDAGFTAEF